MNDPILRLLARYTKALLSISTEAQIVQGRDGQDRHDYDSDLIVIDNLGPDQALATGQSFDGTAEVMTHTEIARRTVTLDFYGPNAHTRAAAFRLLVPTESSRRLQESLGLMVGHPTGITDVKALTGEQWQNRLQIGLSIGYSRSVEISTLRIDTAELAPVLEE